MSSFDGHVLRGPRVAPANDPKTGAPKGGVDADVKRLASCNWNGEVGGESHAPEHGYTQAFRTAWGEDNATHASVDQYRSAVLMGNEDQLEEHLVFAANTANISTVETGNAEVTKGTVSIPRKGKYLCLTNVLEIISLLIDEGIPILDTEAAQPYLEKLEGTISFVDGNPIVTGVGANFVDQLTVGMELMFKDGGDYYSVEVASILSVNELELTEPFASLADGEDEEEYLAVQSSSVQFFKPFSASDSLVLADDGGRDISGVKYIKVRRGDWEQTEANILTLTVANGDIEMPSPSTGLIYIADNAVNRNRFDPVDGHKPGLSRDRGDQVLEVGYYLSAPKFFWTRNDTMVERFGWDGKDQTWKPYKGGSVRNLGVLEEPTVQLTPRPKNLEVGEYLAGTQVPDSVAIVRLGGRPDAGSYALGDDLTPEPYNGFRGILVVPDNILDENLYDFTRLDPSPIAVIGVSNGKIRWNPEALNAYAGQLIWYTPQAYDKKSDGEVGKIVGTGDNPLFICPIPSPTERPLLKIGNRKWMEVLFADNDADLASIFPNTKQVAVSLTTGQVKLSVVDITKADMGDVESPNPDFDPLWAGATLFYDGVSMCKVPQPLRAPAKIADSFESIDGHSVPLAIPVPGLGVSGVRLLQDGTGRTPDLDQDISRRPERSGVKRHPKGFGDSFVFTPNKNWESLKQKKNADFEEDKPHVRQVFINYDENLNNSNLKFHRNASKEPRYGKPLYYQSSDFIPSFYSDSGRMYSRKDGPYTLHGDEVLRLVLHGQDPVFEWNASTLTGGFKRDGESYTAQEVVDSLNAVFVSGGWDALGYGAGFTQSRLYLYGPDDLMSIEVLPGLAGDKDFSGCAALGFNPYWKVALPVSPEIVGTCMDVNWLPDTGSCIGFRRSPYNKGSTNATPDFRSASRIKELLIDSVKPSPFVYLNKLPLEDVAGVDEGVFFEVADGPYRTPLKHMDNILCEFGKGYFRWLDDRSLAFNSKTPVSTISLGFPSVVTESLHPALNGYFFEREPGGEEGFRLQQEGENFIFVNNGDTGTMVLTREIGQQLYRGSKGEFEAATDIFTDTSVDSFSSIVSVGDRLKVLTGDSEGSYLISEIIDETNLSVYPNFPAGSEGVVSYELHSLNPIDQMDTQVVADYVYKRFNHLPQETFEVRVLSVIGNLDGWSDSPKFASVSRDFARDRHVELRVGLEDKYTAKTISVRWLKKFEMGDLQNGSLFLDASNFTDLTHFPQNLSDTSDWCFQLRVATLVIAPSDFVPVASSVDFSEDPDVVEIATDTGEIKFSSDIINTYGQAVVVFEETLRASNVQDEGVAEVNSDTGEVQISTADIQDADSAGKDVYWVSRMVTEDQTDVFLNPLAGAFMFREPLDEYQIVEVSYWTTDAAGERLRDDEDQLIPEVVEFLPLLLRAEECEEVESDVYSFNPTGRTVREDIEPVIYIGPEMANQPGSPVRCSVDYEQNVIRFDFDLPEDGENLHRTTDEDGFYGPPNPMRMWDVRGRKVTITYGVLESFGGEVSYSVSAPPVWRPPFNIEGKQTSFQLLSDRTNDLYAGQMMRLGAFLFYLKAVEYDADNNVTNVSIFPESPSTGAGSRAPGNDVLTLITEFPVARVVDPNDPVVISETPSGDLYRNALSAPHGFMVPLEELVVFGKQDTTPTPVVFEPTPKTRNEIIFFKNLMPFIGLGHLMEIGGCPHTITGLQLSDDGTRTVVSITPPLTQNIVYGEQDVLASFRPVYPPGPITYQGMGIPFLANQRTDLVLWGEVDAFGAVRPGRSLAPVQEYNADPQNGDITFQYPFQDYLTSEQWLTFQRVQVRVLKPRISNGYPELPAFKTKFKHVIAPSEENGLLDNLLIATYSFHSPDSFYYRAVPLFDFAGETATKIIKEAAAKSSSYGAFAGGFSEDNWEKGRVGISVEKSHLYDRDRAARSYLDFFNQVVVGFEQIDEAATGRIVGDRDGKFKFWVGRGMEYVPQGFENAITGRLNPNFAYGRAFQSLVPDNVDVIMEEDDIIVSPLNFEVDANSDLSGEFPESELRSVMFDGQSRFIKNDIDDRVTTSFRLQFVAAFPWFRLNMKGRIKSMDQKHSFSRIFSTKANYFTTTYPGAAAKSDDGDFGIYTFFEKYRDKWRSTWKDTIGFIENPVLGVIENLSDTDMRERFPRARVYKYSAVGFPNMDDELFDGGEADPNSFTLNPRPAAIASVLPLEDFPLKDGIPNFEVMASNQNSPDGDSVADLNSGAFEDHTPPWALGMRLQFGHPNGDFVIPKYNDVTEMFGNDAYRDLYVGDIIRGCVMTFAYKDDDGDIQTVTDGSLIIDETDGSTITLKRSDTLLKMAGDGVQAVEEDDIEFTNLSEYTASLPAYRVGFDVDVVKRSGRIRDITLPSWVDPFIGILEMTGQNPPNPLTRIEGEVEFNNPSTTPTFIPALTGGDRNDSGDYTLPYLKASNTELMRLREAQAEVINILQQDGPDGLASHDWLSVYPDEILSLAEAFPSALRIRADVQPVATEGVYNQGTGIGDLRQGDLLLVENNTSDDPTVTKGVQGILSVGAIDVRDEGSFISVPRFVTQTKEGSPIHYEVENLTAVIADFAGGTDGKWTEADGNPYGSQGVRINEVQVNGPDPLQPWVDGYTQTEIVFNSLMFDVDDGAASIDDGVPLGSGYHDPDSGDYSTGGLNSVLAGASVGTTFTLDLLRRAAPQMDPVTGEYYLEPQTGIDGRVKLRLVLTKTFDGTNPDFLTQDPALPNAHGFEIQTASYPNDAVPGVVNDYILQSNSVWFYTSTEANKPSRMVVRTLHPQDPANFADPFPADHPNAGDPNPDYDPNAVSEWFPWIHYIHLDENDPTDADGDGIIRTRVSNGFAVDTPSIFADSYEEFVASIDVVGGTHAWVDPDRLTLHSLLDCRQGYPRTIEQDGAQVTPTHPYGLGELPLTLAVIQVSIGLYNDDTTSYSTILSSVNSPIEVNGGDPFTFLPRDTLLDDMADPDQPTLKGVGYWRNGSGELKVMGLEGHGNTPVVLDNGTNMISALPTSELHSTGLILGSQTASGSMMSGFKQLAAPNIEFTVFSDRITPLMNGGAPSFNCSKIEKSDVVYVDADPEGEGTAKAGTYLVKYALEPTGIVNTPTTADPSVRPVRELEYAVSSGANSYIDLSFPTISKIRWVRDPEEFRIYVSGLNFNDDFPTPTKTGFDPADPKLYILVNNPKADMPDDVFDASALIVNYSDLNVDDPTDPYFKLNMATGKDAAGAAFNKWEMIFKLFGVSVSNAAEISDFWDNADLASGGYTEDYDDSPVTHSDSLVFKKVSGLRYYSVNVRHPDSGKFPMQRLVGYNWNADALVPGVSDHAVYGIVKLSLDSTSFPDDYDPTADFFSADSAVAAEKITAATGVGPVLVGKRTPVTAGEFQEHEYAVSFDDIPSYIDFTVFDFESKNTNGAAKILNCLLPRTTFNLTFWAETGIFLETNCPKPTLDIARDRHSVVYNETDPYDAGAGIGNPRNDLPPDDVGQRDTLEFVSAPTFFYSEHVSFRVGRTRRWHDVLLGLSEAMSALRFAYEIRRGTVASYTAGHTFHKIELKGPGTQLGPLDNDDVNVNPNDIVRVLDPDTRELKCWGEISNVLSGTELRIWPPGFVGEPPEEDDLVEIYLNKAPVPHEQSNEQLLELATEKLVYRRKAQMMTPENGFPASGGIVKWDDSEVAEDEFGDKPKSEVYMASVNYLTDTNAGVDEGMINFEAEGVKEGDYLIIDPAGELTGPTGVADEDRPEFGLRPYGDRGVDKTLDDFIAGRPAETDDNRGYYKVIEVEQTRIKVSPNREGGSEFIGDTGVSSVMNALHGGMTPDTNEFALYPTIQGSLLTGEADGDGLAGEEGQGDLRPTAFGGEDPLKPDDPDTLPNSFRDNYFSVGPFSYRIIRPTNLLKDDTIELILFHRERILSLMENFKTAMQDDKRGSFWDFQNDRHSFDLGIPSIPETGLGVPRNDYLFGLAGHYMVAPFMNDSDCLSILDRRVVLEDILLDSEQPPFSDPADPFYTKFAEEDGLPLLLGRIDQALNKSGRIRQKRLAWLYLRTTKTDGTLANIRNWDRILRERLAEQERLRRLQESTGD